MSNILKSRTLASRVKPMSIFNAALDELGSRKLKISGEPYKDNLKAKFNLKGALVWCHYPCRTADVKQLLADFKAEGMQALIASDVIEFYSDEYPSFREIGTVCLSEEGELNPEQLAYLTLAAEEKLAFFMARPSKTDEVRTRVAV